ncbi:hypothetical protein MIC448_600009 [Microbacterium sp. C448]|nr:hypothetical protein MIC448_600009 [Microbacterium sp. C448]
MTVTSVTFSPRMRGNKKSASPGPGHPFVHMALGSGSEPDHTTNKDNPLHDYRNDRHGSQAGRDQRHRIC